MAEAKVIAGVLLKDEDRYLLVQETNSKFYGLWGFPGGHADEGETPQQAAIREALEEVSLEVEIVGANPILVSPIVADPDHSYYAFEAKVVGGELKADPSELLDAKWFSLEEIEELDKAGKLRDQLFKRTILKALAK